MNTSSVFVSNVYRKALRLYPPRFRRDYETEMGSVFQEACQDAAEISNRAVWSLALQECRDLPASLIREHWSEFWRGTMQTNYPSTDPSLKTILRAALVFAASFTLLALIYCLIDTTLNSGVVIWGGNGVWNHLRIHPFALSIGLGAALFAWRSNKTRALISGAAGIAAYYLALIVSSWLTLTHSMDFPQNNYDYMVAPFLFQTVLGAIVAGVVGWVQQGWRKVGWFVLAGIVGFNLGWLFDRLLAALIISTSTYTVFDLRIGTFTYFVYYLVPSLFYGVFIGCGAGLGSLSFGRKMQLAH